MTKLRTIVGGTHWVGLVLVLCAWGLFVIRSYQVFGPDSVYVQPFNSDSALPVLMANDEKIDAFRTYIYGQDQIGAWPFIFAQLVRKLTGYIWTPRSIYLMQVVWLCGSLLFLGALCRTYGPLLSLLAALLLAIHPVVRHYFFVLNQRNAWQITALLFAWWCLRQLSNQLLDRAGSQRRTLSLIVFVGVSSFLAIWTSSLSGPFLLAISLFELMRLRILDPTTPSGRSTLFAPTRLFLPILMAVVAEGLLKANYHRHALKHFGTDFRTPTEFDGANLMTNLHQQWQVFTGQSWWPLALWGMLASVGVLCYLLFATFASQRGKANRRAVIDLSVLTVGCGVIAWGSFIVTVVFTWVRLNAYGPRYLAQPHMFGSFAGCCAAVLLLRLVGGERAENKLLITTSFVAIALLLVVKFPKVQKGTEYEKLESIAGGLTQLKANIILLGGYWDTYVLACLAPPNKIIPVPTDDQLLRTPWTPEYMQSANQVVVVHHVFPSPQQVETPFPYLSFGDGDTPPAAIQQHGCTLRLSAPHWYTHDGYTFSLYDKAGSVSAH